MVVRATDPSGEADGGDSDNVVVRVVATDVNEPPRIESGLSELSVHEVDGSREATDETRYVGLGYVLEDGATAPTLDPGNPNVYRASDDDALEAHTWPTPIAGPDGWSLRVQQRGKRIRSQAALQESPGLRAPPRQATGTTSTS